MYVNLINISYHFCFSFFGLSFLILFFNRFYFSLSSLFIIPLLGCFFILTISRTNIRLIKEVGLICSSINFIYSFYIMIRLSDSIQFQLIESFFYVFPFQTSSFNIFLGIDGISILFVVLSNFLIFTCLLSSWFNIEIYIKEYVVCFLLLSCFLVAVFIVLDVLFFYFFFEATLIPMFLIVLIWGSRERKVRAAYYLFLYTFFASMFMLASILYLCYIFNTTNYLDLLLLCSSIDFDVAKIIWLGFFFSFATKLPLMPFHIWLPEAHVEAPTAGSVILAGVLLKLGSYGMIRFLLGFFPTVSLFFLPLICMLSICGIIYTSLTAIRQSDFKRIIAYSSVAHMSLVNIGIFSLHFLGVSGAILQSLSHGFVASALFLCIGVVYDRFHTRIIKYFSGLTLSMPLYAITFLFFSMANIALPGTSSFVGELLLLAGSIHANTFVVFFGATGMVLGGVYSLWLCNRILFGNLKSENNFYCQAFLDITRLEFYVFLPLLVATLFIGVYPLPILNIFKFSVAYLSIAF